MGTSVKSYQELPTILQSVPTCVLYEKSVLLLFLMNHYVPVSCEDPCIFLKYGRRPHPASCVKYYECDQYKGHEKTCPSNEHFSPTIRRCVYYSHSGCAITTTAPKRTVHHNLKPMTGARPNCISSATNHDLFDIYEFWGKTYYLSKAIYISDSASADVCSTFCGYLAEIDDKEEYDFVLSMTEKHNYYGILIGGTDKYTEGIWEYVRRPRRVNYLNWCLGEPNNAFDQDCLGISKNYSCMFDHQCVHTHDHYHFRYLCESDYKKKKTD
ncbi:unnamed protein product [Lymnaea stagnalis]|uniref:C-type lectin domain-containing protein n=1 Tax=Lymnaea stagnalis TaxID=6523 RepID=A0AAV2IEU5_LYMST